MSIYKQIAFIALLLARIALAKDPPGTTLLLPGTGRLCDYVQLVHGERALNRFQESFVPGLYEAIPTTGNVVAGGYTFVAPPPQGKTVEVSIFAPGVRTDRVARRSGTLNSTYNRDENRFSIVNIKLSGLRDERVPGTVPVEGLPSPWGPQTPTAPFTILYAMRAQNIAPGSLKEFSLFKVIEPATGLEILRSPAIKRWMELHPDATTVPGVLVQNVFASTRLGRISSSALLQSGHEVTGVRTAENVTTETLENLIKMGAIDPKDAKYKDLIEGLPPGTRVPFDFSATLLLRPRQ